MLAEYKVPVAYSMVALAESLQEVLQAFMCYWVAFNNIYATIATRQGCGSTLIRGRDGSIQTRQNGSVFIPKVRRCRERDALEKVFDTFSEVLKHEIIVHPSTAFFVRRIPVWRRQPIKFDRHAQRVNGVINVGDTVTPDYPIWSPIDIPAYERYISGEPNEGDRDLLAKQILFLLYTIRNNTFHGGKQPDDAIDSEVLAKALPLLKYIVHSFLQDTG